MTSPSDLQESQAGKQGKEKKKKKGGVGGKPRVTMEVCAWRSWAGLPLFRNPEGHLNL